MADDLDLYHDPMVQDYHWLFSDEVQSGGPFRQRYGDVLAALPPGASVLDCACGIGIDTVTLVNQGFAVEASDGAPAMVAEASRRLKDRGIDVVPKVCRWDQLPDCYPDQKFDAVFCTGNALVHAVGEEAMVASLRGIRSVLRDDGWLVLSLRDWEWMRSERPRVMVADRAVVRDGIRCVYPYVWTLPERWDEPHLAEIFLVFDDGEHTTSRTLELVFRPFRREELLHRLSVAGFVGVDIRQMEPGWFDWRAKAG